MPWLWSPPFSATADSTGLIQIQETLSSPFSAKLDEYGVKTTTGCLGRNHSAKLTITRADDPNDTLYINVSIPDCVEVDNDIDPAFQVQVASYNISLEVDGFDPDEKVAGIAGVNYSLFLKPA